MLLVLASRIMQLRMLPELYSIHGSGLESLTIPRPKKSIYSSGSINSYYNAYNVVFMYAYNSDHVR